MSTEHFQQKFPWLKWQIWWNLGQYHGPTGILRGRSNRIRDPPKLMHGKNSPEQVIIYTKAVKNKMMKEQLALEE